MRTSGQTANHSTPPSLLYRMRDHADTQSWHSFCDVYSPMLYEYCRKRGLQANDAADIVQETLLRVAKGIRKFEYDSQRGRFRDWLYRILYREICRASGRLKPTCELLPDETIEPQLDHDWNEHFYNHILRLALERIRPRFEEDTWEAFTMVWMESKSAREVAEQMNRSLDFVYLSKSRIMKRLRFEVEQLADDAGF